jgi:CRP-like cAMP-binding protein
LRLSTLERVLLLKGAEIFGVVAAEELVPLAKVAAETEFAPGAKLISQGEAGDCLYVIATGSVDIRLREVGSVAKRGPGDCLGEMAVVSSRPRSADCVALSEVLALRVDRDDFWDVLTDRPALSLGVIRALGNRLDEAIAHLQSARSGPPG